MGKKSVILLCLLCFGILSPFYAQILKVDESGHYLIDKNGKLVFLNGDTAWNLAIKVNREDVIHYLDIRKVQQFNTIALTALFGEEIVNVYDDEPFEKKDGKPDPTKTLTTKGNNPADAEQYDYWDHLNFVLDEIIKREMIPVLVVCFNSWIVGSGNGGERDKIIFNQENAYLYGKWIGKRYRKFDNLIWMLGGDRSAVYGPFDYRAVYSAMAEGIADGIKNQDGFDGKADYSGILMSFHPQKRHPNSSAWFHYQPWLSFNSLQACPRDQVELIRFDYTLFPQKPTWLFEGRYEHYTFDYKDWPMRFQAYLTVLAGGFGNVYGHEKIWHFSDGWKSYLHEPGMEDMQHMYRLFTKHLGQYSLKDLVPDQNILANINYGDVSDHCWRGETRLAPVSDRIQAKISKDKKFAIIYTSNGRDILLKKQTFKGELKGAYWYNPRNGFWAVGETDQIEKEPDIKIWPQRNTFDPPGIAAIDNDWVLLVEMQ
jgi:hypothetical protein